MSFNHRIGEQANCSRRITPKRIAAAIALAATLAGCSTTSGSAQHREAKHAVVHHANTPPIVPCFDKLIPDPKPPKEPEFPTAQDPTKWLKRDAEYKIAEKAFEAVMSPPRLSLEPGTNDTVTGDPMMMDAEQQSIVTGATVQIKTSSRSGSGFIVKGAGGKDVVMTAAHVLDDSSGPIDIIDDEGQGTHATSGCYVYQTPTKLLPLGVGGEHDLAMGGDIAVLEMAQRVGGAALQFAPQEPSRGSWEYLTNDQSQMIDGSLTTGDPTAPSEYAGIVLTSPASPSDFRILTGVQPWLAQGSGFTADSLMPGGSGGVVTTGNAEIIGMSIAGPQLQTDEENNIADIDGPDKLSALYDVTVSPSLVSNLDFTPDAAVMMPISLLKYVVAHGNY